MCGIVGLFLKRPELEPSLGKLLGDMLATMRDRGPDSAGFAVYGGGAATGGVKLTLRGPAGTDFAALALACAEMIGAAVRPIARDTHAVFLVGDGDEAKLRSALATIAPEIAVVGAGRRMELYKEIGLPAEVAQRFGLSAMGGTHGIGHTRMATESAVTTDGAHPYTTGRDQCLVHNGSLSNHNSLRRMLMREGLRFETENDTEVAAGYLSWRMRAGDGLAAALGACLNDLDGFYTFVVGTETGFAVLRDPISCKPAVMAETEDWVAFGSEYRALVDLPGIDGARVWEPEPARVYAWERAA
jgi:glutamate synthase domain-containing protein 1